MLTKLVLLLRKTPIMPYQSCFVSIHRVVLRCHSGSLHVEPKSDVWFRLKNKIISIKLFTLNKTSNHHVLICYQLTLQPIQLTIPQLSHTVGLMEAHNRHTFTQINELMRLNNENMLLYCYLSVSETTHKWLHFIQHAFSGIMILQNMKFK